jgi:hypothetical protein
MGEAIESPRSDVDHDGVAHPEKSARGAIAWMLLGCPLFGVGVAVNSALAGWVPVNGAFLALLFGVPAVLTVLTAALVRLSLDATFALATGAAAIAGAWLVVAVMLLIAAR